MRANFVLRTIIAATCALLPNLGDAADIGDSTYFEDELETTAGSGVAYLGAGVAADKNHSSLMVNPALLAVDRDYDLGGTYFFPRVGPKYWQGTIIDSYTSKFAIGLAYQTPTKEKDDFPAFPINKRYQLGFASKLNHFNLGLTVQRAESTLLEDNELKDIAVTSLGIGLYGKIQDNLSWGFSWMNMENSDYNQVSPTTLRLGLAFDINEKSLVFMDYLDIKKKTVAQEDDPSKKIESGMLVLGGRIFIMDYLSLKASYGFSVSGDSRQSMGGGLGVHGDRFDITYSVAKPDQKDTKLTSTLSLNMQLRTK